MVPWICLRSVIVELHGYTHAFTYFFRVYSLLSLSLALSQHDSQVDHRTKLSNIVTNGNGEVVKYHIFISVVVIELSVRSLNTGRA